ncbi:MAG TPA: DUF3145 family protein [Candidatus Angelobacter sp.]|jgi:hypothetical protein|nr:DUF3145 family protein [Candidatus Angelobacter sp.]
MSDRSALTLHVHDCPADQAAAVLAVIDENGLHLEWLDELPADVLYAGRAYTDVEASVGSEDTVASALIEAAPGCSFTVWQDPKYEHDGELVMHHPDLGRFDCRCDASGAPHIALHVVDAAVTHCVDLIPGATVHHLASELQRRLGVPWSCAFDRCEQRAIMPAGRAPAGEPPL